MQTVETVLRVERCAKCGRDVLIVTGCIPCTGKFRKAWGDS